jgi:tripartite ATP-independent transporter DctM subunit
MIELSPLAIGGIGVVVMLALCFAGMRFAFAGALVGTAGLVWLIGWDAGIRTAGIAPYTSGSNYTLSVLPMFILIGYLAYYAGITQSAFEAARRWFGWLPGGLATGTVFAVAGFSAVSGASSAAAAVFAKVAIPEMLRAKYDKRLAAGVCAAGATLDSLIPPSTLLVVYGIITEQSIGKLLVAGFVPGIVSALVYALIITWRCWRNPELGPRITGYSWFQRAESLPATTPIFLVILIIFLSMYFGWATPTEAGALGAFSVFAFALKNGIKRGELRQCLLDSARLTVMIFTVIRTNCSFLLPGGCCRSRFRAS